MMFEEGQFIFISIKVVQIGCALRDELASPLFYGFAQSLVGHQWCAGVRQYTYKQRFVIVMYGEKFSCKARLKPSHP